MRAHHLQRLPCLLLCFLLCHCASHPETMSPHAPSLSTSLPGAAPTTTASIPPSKLSAWEIRGLMGIRGPKKSFSAQFVWLQNGAQNYHLRLTGPLGNGTVLIDRTGNQVTYQDEHKRVSSSNASELLAKETHIHLPVESLYYWIRGLPAKGAVQHATYDVQKQLLTLDQAGYQLHYTAYTEVNGYHLPAKITLAGHGIIVKLVIKNWRVQ